jgi:hypothetical protein
VAKRKTLQIDSIKELRKRERESKHYQQEFVGTAGGIRILSGVK